MRRLKIVSGLVLLAISVGITAACYLHSHGAGIGTGILLAIVIISFLYDHGRHIFWGDIPAREKRSVGLELAMRQGRLTALKQDGEIAAH